MARVEIPWLKGTFTALITPMNEDESIDFISLDRLIDYQLEYADGLVSCGTTAQSSTLAKVEEDRINSRVIRRAQTFVKPVIVGAGSNDSQHGFGATLRALNKGASGTLHVTGYYNKPSQLGIINYFSRVANAAPNLPVVMYNIPGR